MYCEDCKYWTKKQDPFKDRPNGEIIYTDGFCDNEKFVESEDTPIDGLQYWDYESYSAGFATGARFGCIHFARR